MKWSKVILLFIFIMNNLIGLSQNCSSVKDLSLDDFYTYAGKVKDSKTKLDILRCYKEVIKSKYGFNSDEYANYSIIFIQFCYYNIDYVNGLIEIDKTIELVKNRFGESSYDYGEFLCYAGILLFKKGDEKKGIELCYQSSDILISHLDETRASQLIYYNHRNIHSYSYLTSTENRYFYEKTKKIIAAFDKKKLEDEFLCRILTSQSSFAIIMENDINVTKRYYDLSKKFFKKNSYEYFYAAISYLKYYLPVTLDKVEYEILLAELLKPDLTNFNLPLSKYVYNILSAIHELRNSLLEPNKERIFLMEFSLFVEREKQSDKDYWFSQALIEKSLGENYEYLYNKIFELSYLTNAVNYLETDSKQNPNIVRNIMTPAYIYEKYANYLFYIGDGYNIKSKIDSAEIYYLKAIKESDKVDNSTATIFYKYVEFLSYQKRYKEAFELNKTIKDRDSNYWGIGSAAYKNDFLRDAEIYENTNQIELAKELYSELALFYKQYEIIDENKSGFAHNYLKFLARRKEYSQSVEWMNIFISSMPKFLTTNNRGNSTLLETKMPLDNLIKNALYSFKKGNVEFKYSKHKEILKTLLLTNNIYHQEKIQNNYLHTTNSGLDFEIFNLKYQLNTNYECGNIFKQSKQHFIDSVSFNLDSYQAMSNESLSENINKNFSIEKKLNTEDIFISIKKGEVLENGIYNPTKKYTCLIIIKKNLPNPVLLFDRNDDDIKIEKNAGTQKLQLSNKIQEELAQYLKGANNIYYNPEGVFENINFLQTTVNNKQLIEDYSCTVVDDVQSFMETENKVDTIKNILLVANPAFSITKKEADSLFAKTNYLYNHYQSDSFLYKAKFTKSHFDSIFLTGFNNNSLQSNLLIDTNISNTRSGTTDLQPLPYTLLEANKINAIATNNNVSTTLLSGINANEDEVTKALPSFDVIHIGSHGFYKGSKDSFYIWKSEYVPYFRTGLCLAGAQNTINVGVPYHSKLDNGILNGFEIKNLNLSKCKLVVLSSCETGVGELVQAESNYSLQRAFSIAGAKSVLMSLWKIDDKATQLLMTNFYDNWLTKKMGMSKALQQAQLFLKNHPLYNEAKYWAGFVLVGK